MLERWISDLYGRSCLADYIGVIIQIIVLADFIAVNAVLLPLACEARNPLYNKLNKSNIQV